jgi:hypothetical protein
MLIANRLFLCCTFKLKQHFLATSGGGAPSRSSSLQGWLQRASAGTAWSEEDTTIYQCSMNTWFCTNYTQGPRIYDLFWINRREELEGAKHKVMLKRGWNHHKKGTKVAWRKIEGMNQFRFQYMCTWKCHKETTCVAILNK